MRLFYVFLILLFNNNLFSTNFSINPKEKNKNLNQLILYEVGTYSLGLVAMNELWYKNYPSGGGMMAGAVFGKNAGNKASTI